MQDITQGHASPGCIPLDSRCWARWTHTMLVLYYPQAWAMVSSSNFLFHSLHCLPTEQQIKARILNNWKPEFQKFKVLFIVLSLKSTILVWGPDELGNKRKNVSDCRIIFHGNKRQSKTYVSFPFKFYFLCLPLLKCKQTGKVRFKTLKDSKFYVNFSHKEQVEEMKYKCH